MIKQEITESISINLEEMVDPCYFTVLKYRYQNVLEKYQYAKLLFEKYANNIILVPLNKEEIEQGMLSHYDPVSQKIWVDVQQDIYSMQSGEIFFHEFAHMTVHLNHLYEKTLPTGKFKELSDMLLLEFSNYIRKWENKALELAQRYAVS